MRLRRSALFSLALLLAAGTRAQDSVSTPTPVTRSLRCRSAANEWIASWGASGEVRRGPGGLDGREVYRLPTKQLGVWITLEMEPAGTEATLFRTGPEGSVKVSLDASCRPSATEVPIAPETLAEGGFDDEDLRTELAGSGRLVVFLWSPHMPISVDAYAEIEAACRALELPLRALTDPSSNRSYVEKVADERGIPPEARRPLASVELLFRDLAVHTPSVVVFSGGKASSALPGFRSRAAYRDFLEKAAAELIGFGPSSPLPGPPRPE